MDDVSFCNFHQLTYYQKSQKQNRVDEFGGREICFDFQGHEPIGNQEYAWGNKQKLRQIRMYGAPLRQGDVNECEWDQVEKKLFQHHASLAFHRNY